MLGTKDCPFCGLIWRTDWRGLVLDPIWSPPEPGDPVPSLFGRLTTPSRIFDRGGEIIAQRLDGGFEFPITTAVSPGMASLISGGGHLWLNPIETGAPLNAPRWVGVSKSWTPASVPVPVDVVDGKLAPIGQQQPPPQGNVPTAALKASSAPLPSSLPAALYTATERAVYGFGGAAGELWRQDLATGRTDRLVAPPPKVSPHLIVIPKASELPIGVVLSLSYDIPTRRLFAIDEVAVGPKRYRRLLEIASETGRVRTLLTVPTSGKLRRVSLVTLPDGSITVIMQHAWGLAWSAVRVVITPEEAPKWGGWTHGVGELQEAPFLAHERVLLPVRHGTKSVVDTVELRDFKGATPCDEL